MGKRQLRSVESLLRQVFVHLILLWAIPASPDTEHWLIETQAFQARLRKNCRGRMAASIDVTGLWLDSVAAARARLLLYGLDRAALDTADTLSGYECPFALAELISADFSARDAVRCIDPPATPR